MKKYLIYIIWFLSVFIWLNIDIYAENVNLNDKNIKLIENYLQNHQNKISLFAEKYDLKWNKEFNQNVEDLSDMIEIMKKLRILNLSEEKKKEITNKILVELKSLNKNLEVILRNHKKEFFEELTKTQTKYASFWKKIALQLNRLVDKSTPTINKMPKIKRELILDKFDNLKIISYRLNNFGNIRFNNENELKQSFLRLLNSIKREMLELKKVIK